MTTYNFCLNAGRAGSAWLASLLKRNTDMAVVHERLEIEDFRVHTPDIRIMRSFNTYGRNEEVQAFWKRKLSLLPKETSYAETNHTLGKCGLIETLAEHPLARQSRIIVLRRDLAKQCASYVVRGDFENITTVWQWYLAPNYANAIVPPDRFEGAGSLPIAVWYTLEMECRMTYYEMVFGDRLTFLPVRLEELNTAAGARALLGEISTARDTVHIPEKQNVTRDGRRDELVQEIEEVLANMKFDAKDWVARYITSGRNLDLRDTRPISSSVLAA